jgi:hypothetical protein
MRDNKDYKKSLILLDYLLLYYQVSLSWRSQYIVLIYLSSLW